MPRTSKKGPSTWPIQSGKMVKLNGRILELRPRTVELGLGFQVPTDDNLRLFVSIRLREAIIISINQS